MSRLAAQTRRFQEEVLRLIMEAGRDQARDYILSGKGAHTSRQIAEGLRLQVTAPVRGYLISDPYWALYFHDGRRAIDRRGKRGSLVWFKDPLKDPRLNAGRTPSRARDLRRLTRDQFMAAKEADEIYIRKRVKGVAPTPFFSNEGGMVGFSGKVAPIVRQSFEQYLDRALGKIADEKVIKLSLRA
jgi:hypothetical protein